MNLTGVLSIAALAALTVASQDHHPPRFADFPASRLYPGVPVSPVFRTTADRCFSTSIREGARNGPNYAGEWTVVIWGCGTGCQSGVVVNAHTGRILPLPRGMARGADYRLTSRLLVLDPISEPVQPFETPFAWYYELVGSTFVLRDSVRAAEASPK